MNQNEDEEEKERNNDKTQIISLNCNAYLKYRKIKSCKVHTHYTTIHERKVMRTEMVKQHDFISDKG